MSTPTQVLRTAVGRAYHGLGRRVHDVLDVRLSEAPERRAADAQRYWSNDGDERWKLESHWRSTELPGGNDTWAEIGRGHLAMFQEFARAAQVDHRPRRILEWGAGGGANAVHFAPLAEQFVAVDVVQASLDECSRQVAATCPTPVEQVLVTVDEPERALDLVAAPVDLFLCYYVLELVPSREHALRIVDVSRELLRPGGTAILQAKYRNEAQSTRSRLHGYDRNSANMTTFGIEEFWRLALEHGLRPAYVVLVPQNELDERYAYYFLTRPTGIA